MVKTCTGTMHIGNTYMYILWWWREEQRLLTSKGTHANNENGDKKI
jgi:hypothetical protein